MIASRRRKRGHRPSGKNRRAPRVCRHNLLRERRSSRRRQKTKTQTRAIRAPSSETLLRHQLQKRLENMRTASQTRLGSALVRLGQTMRSAKRRHRRRRLPNQRAQPLKEKTHGQFRQRRRRRREQTHPRHRGRFYHVQRRRRRQREKSKTSSRRRTKKNINNNNNNNNRKEEKRNTIVATTKATTTTEETTRGRRSSRGFSQFSTSACKPLLFERCCENVMRE